MEAELSEFSIGGCYRYHLNGKKDSKLGLFIRRNEEDYKIVNFLVQTEIDEVVVDAFSSDVLIQTSLKDVAQVILDFREVRVANKLNLSSRESIYVVGIDFFLSKEIIYRSGMKNTFGIRYCILLLHRPITLYIALTHHNIMFELDVSFLVWDKNL
jgi:hypothetical protein